MATSLVDFHCHLDLYPDHLAAVEKCERAQIYTLAVTTTPKAWPRNQELVKSKRYVCAGLGLHPQLVAERAHELSVWESYLHDARYIGEVGLDAGPRFHRSLVQQTEVFRRILQCCAEAGQKILSVHSVRAVKIVLDLIETHLPADRGTVVLHWFTGSQTEATRAMQLGCLFSVNMGMLQKPAHRRLLTTLPLDHLLTETDGPFTTSGSRKSEPTDVVAVVDELARLRGLDPAEMRQIIAANLRRLITTPK